MNPFSIRSVEHSKHRYETVGDWFTDDAKVTHIEVSNMSDERYEILVAIHELVEKVLCDKAGITEKQVDEFDMNYDYEYKSSSIDKQMDSEPGNDPRAPYHKQHRIADVIERLLAIELDVDWNKYEEEINSL